MSCFTLLKYNRAKIGLKFFDTYLVLIMRNKILHSVLLRADLTFSLNIYLGKISGKKSESFLGCKIELTNLIFKDQMARNCLEDAFLMVFSL